jgi:hypothetical protein
MEIAALSYGDTCMDRLRRQFDIGVEHPHFFVERAD